MAVRASSAVDSVRMGKFAPLSGSERQPIRTCIGCRKRAVAAELLRVVATPGAEPGESLVVVPDPRHRAPGRGAWLHPVPECVELAERRRAFARALKVPAAIDAAAVREYIAKSFGTPTGGTPQEIRAMGTR